MEKKYCQVCVPELRKLKEAGKRHLDTQSSPPATETKSSPPSKKQAKTDNSDREPTDLLANNSSATQPQDGDPNADRWTWLMEKLNYIENNTSSMSKDVANLSSVVQNHSEQIQENKTAAESQKNKIDELTKQQEDLIPMVNAAVAKQLDSFKTTLRKDNELFRAELINMTNSTIKKSAAECREACLEDQTQACKRNLIVVVLPEEMEGSSDLDAVKKLFSSRMGLTGIKIDDIYGLGKEAGASPRALMVTFPLMSVRKKVWFAKSKLKEEMGEDGQREPKVMNSLPTSLSPANLATR